MMIPVVPIIVLGIVVIITYAGASILLTIATAIVVLACAGVIGALGYKMVNNTKSGCDLFNIKKC